MAYEVVMPYHLHMPSYFLETFTEYPYFVFEADLLFYVVYSSSHSFSHEAALASLGIRQSPRGLSDTDPTLGPSGRQERLNCC